jgi:DNA polymerase/3'-5' exonuclease PolX
MDAPVTMLWSEARAAADALIARLATACDRIEAAGGVRRIKPTCHQVDLVCIPRQVVEEGLLGPVGRVRCQEFPDTCHALGRVTKGDPGAGKFLQILTPANVLLDISCTTPDNWGLILAIRTGPAEYAHTLAKRWVLMGYRSFEGRLWRDGKTVAIPDERELYRRLDLPYVEPVKRNL